jgi:hypothetical protein
MLIIFIYGTIAGYSKTGVFVMFSISTKSVTIILITVLLSSCIMVEKADDTRLDKDYFGMHVHNLNRILSGDTTPDTPWPDQEFGLLRAWDSHVVWPILEPEKGKWNFEPLDQLVDLAVANDTEVLYTMGLTPAWAARKPRFLAPYNNPNFCSTPPLLVEDWQNYVRKLAVRYKGKIKYWEIWNEANAFPFYSGSIPEIVTLTREAYKILKEVDPENVVLAPSLFNFLGLTNTAWLDKYLAAGGRFYIDALNYHSYTGHIYSPEQITGIINRIQKLAVKYDIADKPIWNSEGSYHFPRPTQRNAIGHMVRAILVQKYAGIERFCWYAWDNNIKMGGMVQRDRVTKTYVGEAYGRLYDWLLDSDILSLEQVSGGVYVCQVRRKSELSYIIWKNRGSADFQLPDSVTTAVAFDGREIYITGQEYIKVGQLPILIAVDPPGLEASL